MNKYDDIVKEHLFFWRDVGLKNNWKIGRRGVTIWIKNDGIDSYVNPPNNKNLSYILEDGCVIATIKGGLK